MTEPSLPWLGLWAAGGAFGHAGPALRAGLRSSFSLALAGTGSAPAIPARSLENGPHTSPAVHRPRLPMGWVALAFAAGIGAGWRVFAAAPAVWLLRGRAAQLNLLLLFLVASLGAGRAAVDRVSASDDIARGMDVQPRPVTLQGILLEEPEFMARGRTLRGWLKVESIGAGENGVACSGKLQVRLPVEAGLLRSGERLRLHGLLRSARPEEKPWLWVRSAAGILSVPGPEAVSRVGLERGVWFRYRRWVDRFRRNLQAIGRLLLEPADAGFLEALLLGQARGIPKAEWDLFKKTGTVHVLVVSGLHVGLIGGICLLLLTAFRFPRTVCYGGLAGILATYCLLTGLNPPIVRSTVSGLLICWAKARGIGHSPLNLIGLAAAGMLAADPRLLANASFQLSFAAVTAVMAADLWVAPRLPKMPLRSVVRAAAGSTAAWLATLPILAWHFRGISLLAPAANLLIVPWSSGLVACGFLVYAVGLLFLPAAVPLASAFGWASRRLVGVAGWFAALPGAYWSM